MVKHHQVNCSCIKNCLKFIQKIQNGWLAVPSPETGMRGRTRGPRPPIAAAAGAARASDQAERLGFAFRLRLSGAWGPSRPECTSLGVHHLLARRPGPCLLPARGAHTEALQTLTSAWACLPKYISEEMALTLPNFFWASSVFSTGS